MHFNRKLGRALAALPLLVVSALSAAPNGAAPIHQPGTIPHYITPEVELRVVNGELVRLSRRGDLQVVTVFNADGTTRTVQDNKGRKTIYEYDGAKHVIRIR
jgi:hypothetical protein